MRMSADQGMPGKLGEGRQYEKKETQNIFPCHTFIFHWIQNSKRDTNILYACKQRGIPAD